MARRLAALSLATLAALSTPCLATVPSPTVHDGESAPAVAWRKAMEASDLAALARMYDDATASYPPDAMQTKGKAAIMHGYAELFAKYAVKVAVADAHWVEEGPLVVSWGLTTLTLHPKAGGADVVSKTRFTDAAVPADGGWRYLVDHASSPTKP